jgi:hypothetical protein
MLFDVLGFLLLLPMGLANPRRLLYLFIWTAPFMAGNMIGPLFIPYTPWRSAIYCYLFCVFIKSRSFSHAKPLALFALRAFTILSLFSAGAILYAQFEAPYLDSYNQSPLVHGTRVLLSEFIVWLLPLALLWHTLKSEEAPKLIRHILWAGVFYCALGLLQFAVVRTTGYDLFPIVRGAENQASSTIQTVAGTDDEAGRINSICGEPRYLSLYCTIWFFLAIVSGNAVQLSRKRTLFLSLLFLLTDVLTVSRSGLLTLAAGGAGLLVAAFAVRRSAESRRHRKLALVMPVILAVAFIYSAEITRAYEASLLAERVSGSINETISVLGVPVPFEYQDGATLVAFRENPWSVPFGFGAGAWQYYVDPFEDSTFIEQFGSVQAIDSLSQNIKLLARMANFGVVGVVLVWMFYGKLYKTFKCTQPQGTGVSTLLFFFLFWLFLGQITKMGEEYVVIILIATVRQFQFQPRATGGVSHGARLNASETPAIL